MKIETIDLSEIMMKTSKGNKCYTLLHCDHLLLVLFSYTTTTTTISWKWRQTNEPKRENVAPTKLYYTSWMCCILISCSLWKFKLIECGRTDKFDGSDLIHLSSLLSFSWLAESYVLTDSLHQLISIVGDATLLSASRLFSAPEPSPPAA